MPRGFASADAAQAAFYQAFQDLDVDLMGEVWSDVDGVLCLHPGGDLLQGREAVLQSWLEIFGNAEPPSIDFRPLQQLERSGIAIHLVEESIKARRGSPGEGTRVIATNVFVERDGGWYMIEHHASVPLIRPKPRRSGPRLH
jgi:ketosteroid isomerase-like protein